MHELIQQSRPSYTATYGVHRALIWDWAVDCLMSIYDWIGAESYVSILIQLAPAPVGQRITASSEFDWQAQDVRHCIKIDALFFALQYLLGIIRHQSQAVILALRSSLSIQAKLDFE
jgi:hypothetical protein